MKITDVQIDGFGVWSDLAITDLADPLTVFYGPNEAGKTTLLQFVRTVLYGFSPERRQRYLPPLAGGRPGGSLGVTTINGQFRIQRTAPAGRTEDFGDVSIIAADGGLQGGHLLPSLLSNLDEAIFNNVFAIGLRELQELATLNDTEAAQQLYKLSSGMDRVSLVDVMSELDNSRRRLMPNDERDGQLDKLLAQREKLRAELENVANDARRWGRLAAERAALDQEAARIQARIADLEQQSRAVEIAMQIQDKWRRRLTLDDQLKRLKPRLAVEDESLRRLDRLNHVIREREKRMETLREQRKRLREEAAELPVNSLIWSNRGRIEALAEHASWIDTIREHIRKLEPEIQRSQEALKAQCQQLGVPLQAVASHVAAVNERTLTALRGPARAARDDSRRLKQAKHEYATARQQFEELTATIEMELADRKLESFTGAIDKIGESAAKLRRRLQIEERLEKLNRHRQELDEDCLELMESPIMPVRQMVTWGVVVSVGVMLMLIAVFSEMAGSQRIPLIWFGAMCTAGGFFLKHAYQQMNNQELEECQRQLAQVKKHIREATAERDEIDATLPKGGGPVDLRLKKAEEELRRLESLAPLETERAAAQARLEEARKRVQQLTKSARESRQRWQAALKKMNLSEKLTPHKLRLMAESNEKLAEMQRQVAARKKEKEEREEQLLLLSERVTQLVLECGLEPQSPETHLQLRQLNEALAEQVRLAERRNLLKKQDRDARRKYELCQRSIEKLQLKRETLFSKAGVEDEPELRSLADQQKRYQELQRERATVHEQILTAVGIQCSEAAVEQELTAHANLQNRWEQVMEQLRTARQEISELHQRRGELQQEMKTLAQDRSSGRIQLELGVVEQQIAQAKQRWRLLASTGLVLESIRRIYETERQPETLNEASKYLKRFSEGRYVRVWAPLGKNALRVDDQQGRSLPVELLSQGTREAVFLSLRLALVAAYARRGAILPLVLDDVLVNLDIRRSEAAAKVLVDFAAAGHQVMLFTCHDHIVNLFDQLGVETRELPQHSESGKRTVLRRSITLDPVEPPKEVEAETVEEAVPAEPEVEIAEEPAVVEEVEEPVTVEVAAKVEEDVSEPDAEQLLEQLHSIADSALAELGGDDADDVPEEDTEPLPVGLLAENDITDDHDGESDADDLADDELQMPDEFDDGFGEEDDESAEDRPEKYELDERFIEIKPRVARPAPVREPRVEETPAPRPLATAGAAMWWEKD